MSYMRKGVAQMITGKRKPIDPAIIKLESELTRNELMLKAKEKGIPNFRVLNKTELTTVLQENIDPKQRSAIIDKQIAMFRNRAKNDNSTK